VFVAAPGLGIIDSVLDGAGEEAAAAHRGDDWAVEYAGMVRNMLCVSLPSSTPALPSPTVTLAWACAGITASVQLKPCWLALGSLIT
jgi:hypothetical protein